MAEHASALRLLYACLCPLNGTPKQTYVAFVEGMRADVRKRIRVDHVITFLRRAFDVPEEEMFLLLVLVDEGNQATGAWKYTEDPEEKPKQV